MRFLRDFNRLKPFPNVADFIPKAPLSTINRRVEGFAHQCRR
jgi:hypothetical protein